MNILVIGGGGFVGQKLAREMALRGTLRGEKIDRLMLADINAPAMVDAPFPVEACTCDIADRSSVDGLIGADVDVVFLLAAIVSAQAEEEFDTGMRVNLFGTVNVLERCRALTTAPVLVFSSSLSVFGGDVPDPITDWTLPNPQSSYGTQKAMGEMLINDYSRRGMVDGRALRLPTISVRPGAPNRAASSYLSSMFREPLNGMEAICPVAPDTMQYFLSPRRCIENLIIGAEIQAGDLGMNRCMTMPGLTLSIRQAVAAMTEVAGPEPAKLIRWEPQADIQKMVAGWRYEYVTPKAEAFGLKRDDSFADNIRDYMAEANIAN
ncbi:D-erythronate dehydrogenase [Hydrogenophaga sp. PAMC20947]|uniref:D-erythronate dehydrogenase n=1 Tax=Hydrogenophaga sp. PAMC20947 TaxID=2565558 RepID=UPI00109DF2D2|nr:D-erythronate dehydrogenase [Hydrogenophaga sp. PAMC20947]QCB45851.1 SDR family oxidoreductase [Hydrogenophaga sp. PAMC20947]